MIYPYIISGKYLTLLESMCRTNTEYPSYTRLYKTFIDSLISSATQHAMPPELGEKWGTECLKTRFPLPTLLCAGYSVKLTD